MGETATYTDKMSVRHILIIISGIMITFGCSALVFSTCSAFQAYVPDLLGVPTTQWALYITVLYLAEAFSAPFIGNLLAKTDIRIVLSASALLVGVGFILISLIKSMWIFYVAGLMMGLGEVGLLWLAVPTLCNKWFNQKSGTIIGACMAFTGIGGAIWLQVFNALIASGMDVWTIYMIWGIAALVTSLPFTLLCIRSTPEEAGCLPYGKPQTASGKPAGIDASKAMKSVAFYAVFLLAGIINLLTIVAQQFPKYTKSLDDGTGTFIAVGVTMATVMMASQAICKLALGVCADKNSKLSFFAACACGILGVLLVWFGTGSAMILYAGSAVYGFFFASCVVLVPILVRQLFGQREYPQIYSRVSMFVNIVGAVGAPFWAFFGDMSYSILFTVAIVLMVVVLLLGIFCFGKMKGLQADWTE